jgi:hypothetical protein
MVTLALLRVLLLDVGEQLRVELLLVVFLCLCPWSAASNGPVLLL